MPKTLRFSERSLGFDRSQETTQPFVRSERCILLIARLSERGLVFGGSILGRKATDFQSASCHARARQSCPKFFVAKPAQGNPATLSANKLSAPALNRQFYAGDEDTSFCSPRLTSFLL